jgi:hypothetical protein
VDADSVTSHPIGERQMSSRSDLGTSELPAAEGAHGVVQMLPPIVQFSLFNMWSPGDSTCPPMETGWSETCPTYRATISRLWRKSVTTLKTLTEQAVDLGRETKDSVEELGRSAGRRLDEARDEAGGALHAAASSVRTTGRKSSEAIDNIATSAADRLDATGSYVESHDLRGMVRSFGRRHLVAVAAIAFLAGSVFVRATHSCARTREGA